LQVHDFDPAIFAVRRIGDILEPLLAVADGNKPVGRQLEVLDQKPPHGGSTPLRQILIVARAAIGVTAREVRQRLNLPRITESQVCAILDAYFKRGN
jgi:hypothetical protein